MVFIAQNYKIFSKYVTLKVAYFGDFFVTLHIKVMSLK